MTTTNPRVAAYLPDDTYYRFQLYVARNGFTSESKALTAILQTVLGTEEKRPAVDRLDWLEKRIERLEATIEELTGQ